MTACRCVTIRPLVFSASGRWFAAVRSRSSDGRWKATSVLGGYGWVEWSDAAREAVQAVDARKAAVT